MRELFEQLDHLRACERRVAMVTVVATKGTTPKKEGAKMWVGEGGRILGAVTIGGCVDARVVEESEGVLASGSAKLISVPLDDEDAWELGLTCSGIVELVIEPIDLSAGSPVMAAYDVLRREVEQMRRSAVCVQLLDGTPYRLVVRGDGSVVGSLGDAALDGEARHHAIELMRRDVSRMVPLGSTERTRLAFFEVHGPPPTLLVFGAGNIAVPLVSLAHRLGLRAVVVDGRSRFATRERFPEADAIMVGIPSEIAAALPITDGTLVVLVAHDYKYDIPVLRRVLRSDAAYIGMLGSRRRGSAVLGFLAREGESPESLARVHVPIGLDIGARSAAEIALSILAEAVAVRSGRAGASMRADAVDGNAAMPAGAR